MHFFLSFTHFLISLPLSGTISLSFLFLYLKFLYVVIDNCWIRFLNFTANEHFFCVCVAVTLWFEVWTRLFYCCVKQTLEVYYVS